MEDRKCEIIIYDYCKRLTRTEIGEICKNLGGQYVFIYHDKDISYDGIPVKAHWHVNILLRYPKNFETFANYFGVSKFYVNKIGSYAASLKYLTHKNSPHKYQYHLSDVTANFDISQY